MALRSDWSSSGRPLASSSRVLISSQRLALEEARIVVRPAEKKKSYSCGMRSVEARSGELAANVSKLRRTVNGSSLTRKPLRLRSFWPI